MSVLSTISKRLKTDLADVARASVDPVFSQQLTESQFRDRAFEKSRKAALEDAERVRQQQLADEEIKQRTAIQMKLVEDGVDAIKESGNSGPLVRIMSSPGLSPIAQEWAARTINAHLPQGLDGIKKQIEIERTKHVMNNDDKRLVLEKTRVKNQAEQALADDIREDGKIAYKQAMDEINKEQSAINRESYLNHIEQNAYMFTPKELQSARDTMSFGDEGTIKEYWKNLWDRARARLIEAGKDRRSANEIAGRVPSAVTGNELRETEFLMRASIDKAIEESETIEEALNTDFFNWLWLRDKKKAKENRQAIILSTARVAKTFGRTGSPSAADPFMENALKLSLYVDIEESADGVKVDSANSLRFAEEIKRLNAINPGITLNGFIKSLEAHREQDPNTDPQEVLDKLKRAAGIQ